MNNTFEALTFTVPLSFEAHEIAQEYYQKFTNPQKAKQVYLNTLAVYAVDYYLQCMGFTTDWQHSDSRNPILLKFMDVADLEVRQLGKLECRPVLPDAEVFEIPPEVWENRLGYIAVQFNQSLKEATILGYTRTARDEIPLSQLQSLEDFLGYLYQIRPSEPIKLRQWLEGIIEETWLSLEELFNPSQMQLDFRLREETNVTKKGQRINLGSDSFDLIVSLYPEDEDRFNILTQIRPINTSLLPPRLQLIVADELGNQLMSESTNIDDFIQKEFTTISGERFSITVVFEETSITQYFII